MTPHWILIMTHAGRERLAAQNIANQKYEYYLPMIREAGLRDHKKVELAKPLFPRYIFTMCKPQWSSLTGTFGVSAVVMDGKQPRRVPDRIIDSIRGREGGDGFVRLDEEEGLKPGDQVKIGKGVLEGNIGIYQGMDADERAMVLFKMLGSERKILLDPKVLIIV
jgi:transcriptional antiterminator RfaH